ncbi:hypothetical protein ACIODS_33265 [Micromonospora chalcea]|uniref:hypothetical protein n=1 Tax=Micromonospora chalcea TaxID=1874 RepID=UPI0038022AED
MEEEPLGVLQRDHGLIDVDDVQFGAAVAAEGAVSLTVFPAILVSKFQRLGSGR